MALRRRDLVFAALTLFIAWGFLTHWAPLLRFLGYAFASGFLIALLAVAAIVLLSVQPRGSSDHGLHVSPKTAAFLSPTIWKQESSWLLEKAKEEKNPLFVSSIKVSEGIDGLLAVALRNFVTSWYTNISKTPNFTNEIEKILRIVITKVKERVEGLDVVEIAVSKIVPVITVHLKEFYDAEHAIRGKNLSRQVTESEELDLAIAGKYKEGKLHPAASLAYSDLKLVQQEYLRKLVVRLMPELLPESVLQSRVVAVLVREIVSCAVLGPVMQILSEPDTWNQMMEAYGRTMLQDRKSVKKVRAALDEHASPMPKSPRTAAFPKLTPQDDDRRFERFIRAIRQCQNLSDARRFRSEVSSQLRKESMVEGQNKVYLRRLETGKRILDEKVGRLSAVGGSNATPEMRNGTDRTKPRMMEASIQEILHDTTAISYFMEYMDRQKRMAIVQFWVVVDGFRNPLEDDIVEDDVFVDAPIQWTASDRLDVAQIAEAYLSRPELRIPEASQRAVAEFLQAGHAATAVQYSRARRAILRAQSAILTEMQENYFPSFKKSDLFYKLLNSESNQRSKASPKSTRPPTVPAIAEAMSRSSSSTRLVPKSKPTANDLRRNAASSVDLKSTSTTPLERSLPISRRSMDSSTPLFDDDVEPEDMVASVQSLDGDSTEQSARNQEHVVEAMEAALNTIMTDDPHTDDLRASETADGDDSIFGREESHDMFHSSKVVEKENVEKFKERPNLASLGLVNTSSRIGVFMDDDLFGEEEKFLEEEDNDAEEFVDDKKLEDEIHQAAPGDLGLAEAITVLTTDIERLVAQESIVDTLTRKAELTNNLAELRILSKSKASLQREIRRKELQRQQYIVQESDNSLYGRATIAIKSIMVGKEDDGQEFALYVIEVTRQANEHMSAASWAVARRYSEFHDLHQRLRQLYPAVRNLEFPRRRLVMKLQREFLHRRRVQLEYYLRELLRLPAVCRSRDLRAFLSQQAIISTSEIGTDGSRTDIVSRIYNSVADGMDEFLGNIPVLDQLSIAGQNLISAATSQISNLPASATSTNAVHDSIATANEAQAELAAFDNASAPLPPFVKPISDLFLETFELNRSQNWLRGRAVVVVLHQLLGGTVERKIRETCRALVAEANLLRYFALASDTLFPGGELQRDKPVRTAAMRKKSKHEASVMLATLVPDMAGNVVGRGNAQAAARRVFATVNNERLNAHAAFTLLDRIVDILFPADGVRIGGV